MLDDQVRVGDEVGEAKAVNEHAASVNAYERAVWRKFGKEFKCIGVIFSAETADRIVAVAQSRDDAVSLAAEWSEGQGQTGSPVVNLLTLGPPAPETGRQMITNMMQGLTLRIGELKIPPMLPPGDVSLHPTPGAAGMPAGVQFRRIRPR